MPVADAVDLEKLTAFIPGVVYQFVVSPDNTWHFAYISRGIADLFEVSPEDVYENLNCINNCIYQEDLPEHHRRINESIMYMKPWLHEYRIVTAVSRQIKWIRGNAMPQRFDDGSIIWYGILTDITDYIHLKLWQQYHADSLQQDLNQHKQARQELQQQWDRLQELIETRNRQLSETEVTLRNSQGFLEKIINSLAEPLFVKGANHRYLIVNDAACRLAGSQRNNMIGKDDFDFFPQEQAAEIWKHDNYVLETGRGCSYQIESPVPDSATPRTLLIRKTLYNDHDGKKFIVGIVADISERIAAEQQKNRYAQHLTAAIEQERTRLARELHDVLGASLTEQSFVLKQLQRGIKNSTDQSGVLLDQLNSGIQQMSKTVQRICTSLRPSILDELGLNAAVEWLAGEFSRASGVTCKVNWQESDLVSLDCATELFRIVQESLNNIMKHAAADNVLLSFTIQNHTGLLEIRDDGCGVDTDTSRASNSFGLIGMQERVEAIGGKLEIQSIIGSGTTLRLTLPLYRSAAKTTLV